MPTPTPLPAAVVNAKPLREVVYHASFTRRESLSQEHFGAIPPDSYGHTTGDDGTITVDVMAVGKGTLGIKLVEAWKHSGQTYTFLGNVAPDGSVNFGSQTISPCSRELLPFFAPRFAPADDLVKGGSWVAKYDGKTVGVKTTYAVSNIDGAVVKLSEARAITVKAALGMNADTSGWVTYEPSRLVPLAGELTTLQQRASASSSDTIQTVVDFTRVSDTRDP
ncbi:MAG TPA: hypothetical protein VNJ51_00090 [Candidatus Dormibacteraeota bacterium]|nr:hypothetical protein [Candidatus Dormibacteraeota bacterium]